MYARSPRIAAPDHPCGEGTRRRVRERSVSVATAVPTLLEPLHEAGPTFGDRADASVALDDAGRSAAPVPGDGVGRPGEHADEAGDAEDDHHLSDPDDEEDQTDDHPRDADQQPARRTGASGGTSHGGGEFRVL